MKSRLDRLARARSICQTIWRLEQMRLKELEAEHARLSTARSAAFAALEHVAPALMIDRIGRIASRLREIEILVNEQRIRSLQYGRRAKLTEDLHDRESIASRRDLERAEVRRIAGAAKVSAP